MVVEQGSDAMRSLHANAACRLPLQVANLLFIEGPRGVGFSWQNKSESSSDEYNDMLTAEDNYLALRDFFSIYPEFANRKFYIAG